MGNRIQNALLAQFDALVAGGLVPGRIADEMLRLDAPSIRAVIVIVIDVPVGRRIFGGIGVIWADLCHCRTSKSSVRTIVNNQPSRCSVSTFFQSFGDHNQKGRVIYGQITTANTERVAVIYLPARPLDLPVVQPARHLRAGVAVAGTRDEEGR